MAPPSLAAVSADDPVGLAEVARFADRVGAEPWFAAVGEAVSAAEIEDARRHVAGLGYRDLPVAAVGDWPAAASLTRDPAWDAGWWQKEEALRARLLDEAGAEIAEVRVLAALTRVTDKAGAVVMGAASVATARAGVADPYLARVAAGAATQAAYHMALVVLTGGAADHPFAAKYRLYRAGRWPLGIVGGAFHLF